VCDLEPGITTVPFNRDFFTISFIRSSKLKTKIQNPVF